MKAGIGSEFDTFLKEEGLFDEVNASVTKRLISQDLHGLLVSKKTTKTDLSRQLDVSLSELESLLDPFDYSSSIVTLVKAAKIIGKKLEINLV